MLKLPMNTSLIAAATEKFIWSENLSKILWTALLSMVPMYEGRYAVPAMIGLGLPPAFAWLLAGVASTVPMPFILLLLRPVLDWFYTLPIKPVRAFAAWLERRSEKKKEKMHAGQEKGLRGWLRRWVSAETIELIGLYIFVALPLPGTGCWTGSAIATLFKMPRLKSAVAIFLGNMTACAITTLVTLGVVRIF
ncbi:MAG: small multi-drug export protein [Clostridia bacterium]|nr:small multi-drug export protein [Clostridia bacterium]